MSTKLNVNIRTLLLSCEELGKDEANYWRLKKFIKSLDIMIDELKEIDDTHSAAKIPNYIERLQALKTLINYNDVPLAKNSVHLMSKSDGSGDNALREVRQLQDSKKYGDLRKELMNEDTVRRRKPEEATATDNMGEAVKYYSDTQEKIAEHMLSLTRNLREQTETANRIIKKDTETVNRSTGMADKNINSLHKETQKLENHSRNAWRCWMWMMVAFVIAIFIGMVLFMKIMKKKI